MAKARRDNGEEGVNLDSLMDALTNVVGILMIVFILVQLNAVEAVKKILSELPEVTQEMMLDLQKDAEEKQEKLKYLEEDWEEKQDPSEATYAELKAAKEEKRRLEETYKQQNVAVYDFDALNAKREELQAAIATKEQEENELLTKLEEMQKLLDDTPVYVPPQSKVVRLPNPRPIPEEATEYKFLVSGGKIAYIDQQAWKTQFVGEFERIRDNVIYRDPPPKPFGEELQKRLGEKADIRRVWPAVQSLSSHFQIGDLVVGLAKFSEMGFEMEGKTIERLAQIAGWKKRDLLYTANAIEAAENGDLLALRPLGIWVSPEPKDGKHTLGLGEDARAQLKPKDKAGLRNFLLETLDDAREIRSAYKDRHIFDGPKTLEYMTTRAKLGDRTIESIAEWPPSSTRMFNKVGLREGQGEDNQAILQEASTFQRAMRKIASDEKSYAWFYVAPDSLDTYLDARNLAEDLGANAGWEPYGSTTFVQQIPEIELARNSIPKDKPPPPPPGAAKTIKAVGKTLD